MYPITQLFTAAMALLNAGRETANVGYQGPGVYTITNVAKDRRADLFYGGAGDRTPIYSWCSSGPVFNSHQYWQISELGNGTGVVQIINYGTGTLMAAAVDSNSGSARVTGSFLPPRSPGSRWIIQNGGLGSSDPSQSLLFNLADDRVVSVLDLDSTSYSHSMGGCDGILELVVNPVDTSPGAANSDTNTQLWELTLLEGY